MTFKQIIKDIRSLKIQGAQAVAKSAVKALQLVGNSRAKTSSELISNLRKARTILFKSRPTEPAMRNALNYILYQLGGKDIMDVRKQLKFRSHKALSHFIESERLITQYGSRLIKNNSIIYTHCHSSTVINILKEARTTKKFEVHNTETRPLYQGRKTAKELTALKIPVFHFVDSAARLALKDADIMLLGADAITSTGKVINKIGSELIAEAAERYQIPLYICTDSWKYDPKTPFGFDEPIEDRSVTEVWPNAPKKVKIMNPAFEKIDPSLIAGIISELGIFSPESFIQEIRTVYDFLS
ncbi:translation initiation factor eIF-2B [Candidatus Woesearchaeota archaeon]|nr:translation initiation factor eIF-2B [Candidatus Woesearchaeota archaeon]